MKIFNLLYRTFSLIKRLNLLKTLYFNFKVLPLKQAVKIPFLLYGKVHIWNIKGKVKIDNTIKTGMIKVGFRWYDLWPTSFLPTQILVKGQLIFKGPAVISGGANISVQSNEGLLILGKDVLIGGGSVCKCMEYIEIGDCSRVTGNCIIMDCNMHFVKNVETGVVLNNKGPIKIGKNCWINPGSIVTKGANVPDYSISGRNAYLSKDYSEYGTNLFLVGSPAKPLSTKVQRIFSISKESEILEYFEKHPSSGFLQLQPGIEEE